MSQVEWREVTLENWQEALRLAVRPEQLRFIADYQPIAAIALAKAYLRPGDRIWTPYALYRDTDADMVGFTALSYQPGSADDYWIFHYFVDWHYQGRGYGSVGLVRLIERIKGEHPQCQVLQLTVHPENRVARRLYTAAGFEATGGERWGEQVYRLALRETTQLHAEAGKGTE
jgi:diamine N-acetyltransferase